MHEKRLTAALAQLGEHEVHTTVNTVTLGFRHPVALQPNTFRHKHFKLAPAHAIERVCRFAAGHISHQVLSFTPPLVRNDRT